MSLDHAIGHFFATHHRPALTPVVWAVTTIGNEITLTLATLALIAATVLAGRHRDSMRVFAGMGGAAVLTVAVKHLVRRDRPGAAYRVPGAGPDNSYSFPSGHTLNTTVFVLLLVVVLWPSLPTARTRLMTATAAGGVAVSVAMSRLYLGYHWATDVVAGLAIGCAWVVVVVTWSHTGRLRNPARIKRPAGRRPSRWP